MLKELSNKLRMAAAVGVLGLAPLAASASILNFDFSTVGSGTLGASCGASCTQLNLSGTTEITGLDSYFGGSTPTFQFTGLLDFTEQGPWFGGFGAGAGPTGGWQLSDGIGDSLSGFFLGFLSGTPSDPVRLGSFFYGVSGGTGLFGSAWGSSSGPHSSLFGGSFTQFSPYPGQYTDSGSFSVEVPEPGVITLFLAGLAALGWTMRKQARRSSVTVNA